MIVIALTQQVSAQILYIVSDTNDLLASWILVVLHSDNIGFHEQLNGS